MSTLRISNIEAKADSSSPTVDEQLKFTNSDGDVLLHLDGRTAGITTVGINTTNSTIKFDANNNILITGIVTATEFHGTLAVGTSVTYGDNEKAYFGNGLDLSIYHNGTESIIHDNGSGNLKLRTDSFRLRNAADTEHIIKAIETGSVELYFNTIKKFETTNTGVSVSGEITCNVNSNIDMSQSADGQLQIGGSGYTGAIALNDDGMQIYHNSTSRAIIFGTNETERIRINSAGLVGIATNSPQATLHVRGSVKFTNAGLQTNFSSTDTEFDVRQTNSTGWSNMNYATHPLIKWNWVSGPGDHLYLASGGNTPVTTQMAMLISDSHGVKVGRSGWDGVNSTDLSTEYFRINTDGDVLINTSTTPTADIKLLVSGNGGVSSGSYFSFRGDYGNVPEPAAYAIKYDSSLTNLSGAGGLHQYAYGGIAFNLGGQDRVNFKTTGEVGIGTAVLDSKLTVAGDSATSIIEIKRTNTNVGGSIGALNFTALDGHSVANMLAIADGDNEGAHLVFKTTTAAGENSPYGSNTLERLRITNVGRVYIGGQSGRSPGGLTPQLQIEGIDVGTSSMSLTRNSANSGGASIILNKTRGTALNADTAVKGNDTLGIIQFAGNDGGDSDTAAAWVLAKVDDSSSQTMTSNEMPGRLEFYTRSDTSSGSLLERLRITSTGLMYVNRDGVGGRIDATAGDSSIKILDGNGRSSIKVSDPGSGNSYQWELTSAGNFKAPAGNTKGIDFSAKTNLGGATDTTLAHYEEGTWTPSMTNLDVPGHVTTNYATYTRVGRIVTISVKFTVSNSINDGSGFGFELPFGPISDRQIVIPAISDRSGSNKQPFSFNNVNSDHKVYAKALEGYAFQTYNMFSGNYLIVTGSYETDA